MRPNKPVTVSDVPILKYFFRKSGWRDMSLKRFLTLLFTFFFWKRTVLNIKDEILNRNFGLIMEKYSRSLNRPFRYVYIGANDGVISDTIMKYVQKFQWQGILVEPVPHLMEALKKNFIHLPDQIYEQVAIDEKDGVRKLYTFVKNDHQPIFAQLLHSFSEQSLREAEISWGVDKDRDIKAIEVQTLTLKSLLKKHNVTNLDLLVIDTEGYDFTILNSINFKEIQPKFIKFETSHMNNNQLAVINNLLQKNSYKITRMRGDYFCERTS